MTIEDSRYVQIAKQSGDVVTLADMKDYLKVSGTDDDTLIQSLIDSAVEMAERFMRRDILTTTYENYRPNFWQDLTLRRGAFQSVESIEYLVNNAYDVLDPSNYDVSIGGSFGVVCEIDQVPSTDYDCNAVKITFKTGFGDDATSVPEAIKTAIKAIVAFMYENRGDCGSCGDGSGIPIQAKVILRSYKIIQS
jgi:uncharacterized phiE125 gp8 family phage protein